MTTPAKPADLELHKKFAVDCFNHVWSLLDKPKRTSDEDAEMIHAAHASRFHWSRIGQPINFARGDWQLSRVYSVLNLPAPARFYAQRCLDLCTEHNIGDFDLAYAYEALARASGVAGDRAEREKYLLMANKIAAQISGAEDRKMFLSDLATIPEC